MSAARYLTFGGVGCERSEPMVWILSRHLEAGNALGVTGLTLTATGLASQLYEVGIFIGILRTLKPVAKQWGSGGCLLAQVWLDQ